MSEVERVENDPIYREGIEAFYSGDACHYSMVTQIQAYCLWWAGYNDTAKLGG